MAAHLPRAARISFERLDGIEPPVVERAAGNGAFEFFRARLDHRLDVLDRREAA